jgi:hypothetical protein
MHCIILSEMKGDHGLTFEEAYLEEQQIMKKLKVYFD